MIVFLLGAIAIGLCLGFLGAGGSILTVPVVHFVVGHEEKTAIAESLAIVGGIAGLSALSYARAAQIDAPSVLLFGLPGMAGTYLGAALTRFVSGAFQIVVFGAIVLVAAGMMLQRRPVRESPAPQARQAAWLLVLCGVLVGVITGFVGVGGGFLIVPGLVLLARLPMRLAVGTSLVIITLNSSIGFVKHLALLHRLGGQVDWTMMGVFVLVGVAGGIAGARIGSRLNQDQLRRAFAIFLVIMAGFILYQSAPQWLHAPAAGPARQVR